MVFVQYIISISLSEIRRFNKHKHSEKGTSNGSQPLLHCCTYIEQLHNYLTTLGATSHSCTPAPSGEFITTKLSQVAETHPEMTCSFNTNNYISILICFSGIHRPLLGSEAKKSSVTDRTQRGVSETRRAIGDAYDVTFISLEPLANNDVIVPVANPKLVRCSLCLLDQSQTANDHL